MHTADNVVVDSRDVSTAKLFKLLKASVVPRPIAWTSTVSRDGVQNLAPFSFFTVVSSDPPLVLLSLEPHESGRPKDTADNIAATGEFVVNIASSRHAGAVNATSAALAPDVDETVAAGLASLPCRHVRPRRIAEAAISLECLLHSTFQPGSDQLIIGEVLAFHIAGGVLNADGHIDIHRLDPLARIAADFARITPLSADTYELESS